MYLRLQRFPGNEKYSKSILHILCPLMCVFFCWRNQFRLSNNTKCSVAAAPKGTFIFIACPFNCYSWLLFSLLHHSAGAAIARAPLIEDLYIFGFRHSASERMSIELPNYKRFYRHDHSCSAAGRFWHRRNGKKNVRKSPPSSDKIAKTRLSGNFIPRPLAAFGMSIFFFWVKWFRHTKITWKMANDKKWKKKTCGKKIVIFVKSNFRLIIVSPIFDRNNSWWSRKSFWYYRRNSSLFPMILSPLESKCSLRHKILLYGVFLLLLLLCVDVKYRRKKRVAKGVTALGLLIHGFFPYPGTMNGIDVGVVFAETAKRTRKRTKQTFYIFRMIDNGDECGYFVACAFLFRFFLLLLLLWMLEWLATRVGKTKRNTMERCAPCVLVWLLRRFFSPIFCVFNFIDESLRQKRIQSSVKQK